MINRSSFFRRAAGAALAWWPLLALAAASSDLPLIPPELHVELVAREPLVRNPCAMAFDSRGRLFVGQGPQYRNPKPDTPPDSVLLLIDTDGDGVVDKTKVFATGLNCIQGLAWHGRDLWIANSPDLTVVRDLDGDDEADEYVRVYTDLGNIEHAIHGLNWAPDGKLYFSKGNSKGLNPDGRIAPKAFHELWGTSAPAGSPDIPPPVVFKKGTYHGTYQNPGDNWGREGGVLRADDMGANLEIVSRGMRNPWDISYDDNFNWLGMDNDQNDGDRIVMPFFGAHFGWAHSWSADWTGAGHLPTAPVSGPVFTGSGTGVIYYDHPQMPPAYRRVWFLNDWLRKTTFVYRPTWDGALVQPTGGKWEEFARGRQALYEPVDTEIGPEGAIYLTGWGQSYGAVWKNGQQVNEGRIFRISWPQAPATNWNTAKRAKPLAQWAFKELAEDLGSTVRVWNVDAQDEIVRRGVAVLPDLTKLLAGSELPAAGRTWALWAVGRIGPRDRKIDDWFSAQYSRFTLEAQIQAIRIVAHRVREYQKTGTLPAFVTQALTDPEPRLRFAAVQAITQARQKSLAEPLCALAAVETDRVTFYSAWQGLRALLSADEVKKLLHDSRAGVRRAALLAALESDMLDRAAVTTFMRDSDPATAGLAGLWIAKQSGNSLVIMDVPPGDFTDQVDVGLMSGLKPSALRYTLDGSEPAAPAAGEKPRAGTRVVLKDTTTIKAAVYVGEPKPDGSVFYRKIGNTMAATWTKRAAAPKLPAIALEPPTSPNMMAAVLPLIAQGDADRGKRLFEAAGCISCHVADGRGRAFGPDLNAMGDKADERYLIESMLQPNAVITEGFSLQTVGTRDGKSFAGVLKEETNRTLTLVQPDTQLAVIEKASITHQESAHLSIMPSFESAMSPQQMADIAVWLLTLHSEARMDTMPSDKTSKSVPEKTVASPAAAPAATFAWEMKEDRLVITRGGKPAATYVFKDAAILRPGFQNLFAPDGTQVSRRHPPVAPEESTDHDTMHPGLWLGFGDINGEDFWRNKARIEHVRFTAEPAIRTGQLVFAVENQLIAKTGQVIGTQQVRFALKDEGDAFWIDCETIFKPGANDLVFGQQEEMGFGVRVTEALTEKKGGLFVNSEGVSGAKAAWGKIATWGDYSGPLDGRRVGVALFTSPANPYRSWWHSRDYGVVVVNPFGPRVLPAEMNGKLTVKTGSELRMRFAAMFYSVPVATPPDLPAAYRAFSARSSNP